MKKEIIFVVTLLLFGFSYMLDYFAGPLNLKVNSPLIFLDIKYFNLFPMTFVSIATRSIAIAVSIILILSMMERQYFKKALIVLFLIFIAEIYAFQQLATGAKITPILWTLPISYSGVWLFISVIFYIFAGISNFLIPSHDKSAFSQEKSIENNNPKKESVLNP